MTTTLSPRHIRWDHPFLQLRGLVSWAVLSSNKPELDHCVAGRLERVILKTHHRFKIFSGGIRPLDKGTFKIYETFYLGHVRPSDV